MHERLDIFRWAGGALLAGADEVASERPLEINLNGRSLAVTMRTPGDDEALAAGFLYAEGLIRTAADILSMQPCLSSLAPDIGDILMVRLVDDSAGIDAPGLQRNFVATSSCGMCGKSGLEAARCSAEPLAQLDISVSTSTLFSLGEKMRAGQREFEHTGGLHAAALFDLQGSLTGLKEDVGRHNAVDKVVGAELLAGRTPLERMALMVSGRSSFEIVQKASMARIPILCAVSAPSSLAVKLARDLNITLIGFLRERSLNIYSAPERVQSG
ncbi:MAG TPA: formate dehydrogenase accessory sulfurtransferase FdhD [Chthonomonadales bacterium]|nr:formate dehydrogenase accessory sulfurtransferase FdhD [Chthonomonadales bacterium]